MIGECEVQTDKCIAKQPAAITAVWGTPGRKQINVCRSCLDEMVRSGDWEIEGARIAKHVDIVVYDENKNVTLVLEVKKRPAHEPNIEDLAKRVRRNLLAHCAIPRSKFFIVAFYPSPFFLWSGEYLSEDAPPDFSFDVQQEIDSLLPKSSGMNEMRRYEYAIKEWVSALINRRTQTEKSNWLYQSGLLDAISGGNVFADVEWRPYPSVKA
ncbi:MAG: hypothetical protein P4L55_23315 [Syntrophobacteraceae bacterium]|nr:hypothetical protein [Syntrophobacteraceae bacterium]